MSYNTISETRNLVIGMKRRTFVKSGLAATTLSVATNTYSPLSSRPTGDSRVDEQLSPKSGLRHSVCKWCYPDLTVEELALAGKSEGLESVELLDPDDWQVLKKHGMTCAMANGASQITKGFNRIENHEWLIPGFDKRLREAAAADIPNVICFSGNREGMDDEQGLENCVIGLQKIMPAAERLGVNVCMELLNSRVDHHDYQCDHTAWGVELVKRVGSDRFKLLYDIYHMQIMEGDVIRTIRDNIDYIGHFHTGGNPGRHEIDETQELNYRAIAQAIADTGFTGFIAQEFIPTHDPATSLRQAILRCSV